MKHGVSMQWTLCVTRSLHSSGQNLWCYNIPHPKTLHFIENNVMAVALNIYFSIQNKVTEKFKRPLKKRHSSVYHQPTNRVNKFLAQAIEARSVHREKSSNVHLMTLCFKEPNMEAQVILHEYTTPPTTARTSGSIRLQARQRRNMLLMLTPMWYFFT